MPNTQSIGTYKLNSIDSKTRTNFARQMETHYHERWTNYSCNWGTHTETQMLKEPGPGLYQQPSNKLHLTNIDYVLSITAASTGVQCDVIYMIYEIINPLPSPWGDNLWNHYNPAIEFIKPIRVGILSTPPQSSNKCGATLHLSIPVCIDVTYSNLDEDKTPHNIGWTVYNVSTSGGDLSQVAQSVQVSFIPYK